MRTRRIAAVAVFALMGAPPPSRSQAGLLIPTRTGRPDARVLSLREMSIDVGIARGYARVNVRQVFENRTGDVQEGTYRFRLPPSAAIGDFAVWDDLVRIPGVILEKRRARALYQELTTQRIDPGLLQQGEEDEGGTRPSGGAAFSAKVAPVPPYATKRLEIQFQQEVPFTFGRGEFRLALRPPDGEPPVAAQLTVRVSADADATAGSDGLALSANGAELALTGTDVPLDRDLVVTLKPRGTVPVRLSAFRNPDGVLPDGVALAPWERASELPPERDGFFLLEVTPPGESAGSGPRPVAKSHPPVALGILFDTSLSHRFSGLEKSYASLVRLLQSLSPRDRFALVAFDRNAVAVAALGPASAENVEAALTGLRARPLGAGTDVVKAVAEGRRLVGDSGRLVLLSDGPPGLASAAIASAKGPLPLFAALAGEETPEAIRATAQQVLPAGAPTVEEDLFFERVVGPLEKTASRPASAEPSLPFRVSGGEPRLRDVYAVLVQPPAAGSLSGWIGRYAVPEERLRFDVSSPLLAEGRASLEGSLPEKAILARDLPRRWARARVDHLLALIEAEGERREWVDEVIALSKRYKFVTPYTAFLAAPRSLLRPRRIQPGDPVLRVECDPSTVSAVALFPFGLRLPLVRRPGTQVFEGRFLVPEGLPDGPYTVRIVLRDVAGGTVSEAKRFVIDGRAPVIVPELPRVAHPGEPLRVAVRTDEDVIVIEARLGEGAPVPLRWDEASHRSVGFIQVPAALLGAQKVFIEAVDAAKNRGFARGLVEVRP